MRRTIATILLLVGFGLSSTIAQDTVTAEPDFNFVYQYGTRIDKYNTKAAAQFFDNPTAFTGKSIRIIARLAAGGQLRATVGYNVKFIGFTEAPMEFFFVTIPRELDVPNISEYGDPVIITFRCEQGRLDQGNVALSVVRANR
ncbi:MAG: hypothetical protein AAGU26_01865 [bacterium]|jgi:hypothetical protein